MLLIFLCSFITTALLTYIIRRLAVRCKFLDQPSSRKFHKSPTPLMGGVAIFLGFWVVTFIFIRSQWLIPIFIGSLIISGVGLWDDRFVICPRYKLFFQFIVSLFTVTAGARASVFLPVPLSYIVSILWIIVITNAFNLLDNMDGVSCGIAFVASLILFFVSLILKNYFISSALCAFMGALLGFLIFNFPPASIFMGDCGSMFIGYIISIITILGTYYRRESPTLFPVVIPLLVLAVPIFDVLSVICIRLIHRKPIFQPDKNHFSHRLVNMGMDVRPAVLFLYLLTFCVGLPSVLLPQLSLCGVVVVFLQTVGIMAIIAILECYGKKILTGVDRG